MEPFFEQLKKEILWWLDYCAICGQATLNVDELFNYIVNDKRFWKRCGADQRPESLEREIVAKALRVLSAQGAVTIRYCSNPNRKET